MPRWISERSVTEEEPVIFLFAQMLAQQTGKKSQHLLHLRVPKARNQGLEQSIAGGPLQKNRQ